VAAATNRDSDIGVSAGRVVDAVREVAAALFFSESTVKTHVARVLSKLELRDRARALVLAY
jgi:DNA-binding NarL/FixJ family response regulator